MKINPASYITNARKEDVRLLKSGDYDVFHPTFVDNYFLKYLRNKPSVLTIHDVSQELFPEYAPLTVTYPRDTKKLIPFISRFIADSYSTKTSFVEYYDVDSDLVDVVHLGSTITVNNVSINAKNIHSGARSYLLFVNLRGGRKNFYTCLAALEKIIVEYGLDVVCAGGGVFSKDELAFFQNHGIANRMYQYSVNKSQLISLYRDALVFIFPSLLEGFGLPTLEAFSCGCPVISSNAFSLPEVGGDAAVYFDPKDVISIREAVLRVIGDDKLRENLREKGYIQLEKFSWEKCAKETKQVYEKVLA